MHGEGFEPSHLTIVGLKSTALDHSAIRAIIYRFLPYGKLTKRKETISFIFKYLFVAVWNLTYYIIKMSLNNFTNNIFK